VLHPNEKESTHPHEEGNERFIYESILSLQEVVVVVVVVIIVVLPPTRSSGSSREAKGLYLYLAYAEKLLAAILHIND